MPELLDTADDWRTWEGLAPVVLERARRDYPPPDEGPLLRQADARPAAEPAALAERYDLPAAKKRALSLRERAASGGALVAGDAAWLVPAQLLPEGVEPRLGDVLADERGKRWTVLEATLGRLGATWRLVSRDLVAVLQLADLVDVERPLVGHDAAGVATFLWPPEGGVRLHEALPCRVQPQRDDVRDELGVRGLERRFDVLFAEPPARLRHDDRIVWRGRHLSVVGVRQAEQLGEPTVVEAVLLP